MNIILGTKRLTPIFILVFILGCKNESQTPVPQPSPKPKKSQRLTKPPSSVKINSQLAVHEVILNSWLNINTAPRRGIYFPHGGMRDFYHQLSKHVSYGLVRELSGMSVFLKGPHGETDLDLQSDSSFGHYNPEFVKWLSKNVFPIAKDEKLRNRLQESYDSFIRPLAQIYFGTYLIIKSDPSFLREQTQNYLDHMEKTKTQKVGAFHQNFTNYIKANYGWDSYLSSSAIAFWLRRKIDGTFDIFGESLAKMLKTYDPYYYHYLKAGPQVVDPIKGPLPFFETKAIHLPNGLSVLLFKSKTVPETANFLFERIRVIGEDGTTCVGTLSNFEVVEENQCCAKKRPKFVVGRYNFNKGCDLGGNPVSILPDKIDRIVPVDYGETLENFDRWVSDTYTTPSVNRSLAIQGNYDESEIPSFRWTKSDNGKIWLDVDGRYLKPEPEQVELKNCLYEKNNEIEALYCELINNDNQSFGYSWSLVYENGELIYANGEGKGVDGYGPFHYETKDLVAVYEAQGNKFLMFRPGFVIYKLESIWIQQSRQALRYYGECDCAE